MKLKLITFFITKDEHLSNIVRSSLRPYDLAAVPDPLLSLSLNIKSLLEWYCSLLDAEMLNYCNNAIVVSIY